MMNIYEESTINFWRGIAQNHNIIVYVVTIPIA